MRRPVGSALLVLLVPNLGLAAPIKVAVEQGPLSQTETANLLAQINDDTYYDFTAVQVNASQIDTAAELALYDVVLIGDDGYTTNDWNDAMMTALNTWVSSGNGGVVTTGWADWMTDSADSYAAAFDDIIPIDVNPGAVANCGDGDVTISAISHPVTSGVSSFSTVSMMEGSALPVDATGALILGTSTGCTSPVYNAVVVGTYGSGNIVYLANLYSGRSSYSPSDLRTGNADRLLEQALNWAANNALDSDGDGDSDTTDCNDSNASIYTGATETVGNNVDENCDGALLCYTDGDNDLYGTTTTVSTTSTTCAAGSQSTVSTDCNDSSSAIKPGASETAGNDVDENCDNSRLCYTDGDNDTYGTTVTVATTSATCVAGSQSTVSTDCNDSSSAIRPGATETAGNDVDENCDGSRLCYTDADNDAYGTSVTVSTTSATCSAGSQATLSTDCDDLSALDYPGAAETVNNGDDEDCDGVDSCYTDADDDNYGTTVVKDSTDLDCNNALMATLSTDCDDTSNTDYPGAAETVNNGDDEDCDGVESCYTDADDDNYGTSVVKDSADLDCADASEATVSTDCNDSSSAVRPGATEIVGNGVDENCDGAETCYTDGDGDSYGVATTKASSDSDCADTGEALNTTDCDDASATDYPGATEIVGNGDDESCDGAEICYNDADDDNYGTSTTKTSADADCLDANEATVSTDCADSVSARNPGATELVGNGIDENCDGGEACYYDGDGDDYGVSTTTSSADADCVDTNEATLSTDCDDAAAADYPGAAETVGNNDDEDCNGGEICYTDGDGDGYGTTTTKVSADADCSDAGESTRTTDCNDGAASAKPGGTEVCNSIDDDCDGTIDDGVGTTYYADADSDGYGDLADKTTACSAPTGYVTSSTDCDDTSSGVSPVGVEVCNDLDDDCDGTIDEVGGTTFWLDGDGDGFGDPGSAIDACSAPVSYVDNDDDCDDFDSSVNPDASEAPNGIDDDCSGVPDDHTNAYDDDGDGYTENGGDCDDDDGDVHPGVVETCNGTDDDCDGTEDETTECYDDDGDSYDEGTGDCDDDDPDVSPGALEIDDNGIDDNCDGFVDEGGADDPDADGYTAAGGDCEPEDGDIHPGADELPNDVDDDCDGTVDEGTDRYDDDEDGFSEDEGDCDDDDDGIHPDAVETPDGTDEDCDGVADDGTDVFDDDADGFTEEGGDCDDADADVNPSETEADNGIDDNCDDAVDEGFDTDADGFTVSGGDCDDADALVNPDAEDVCDDGVDNDCSGAADDGCETGGEDPEKKCGCGVAPSAGLLPVFLLALLAPLRRRKNG